jgi:hypothetical protein
MDNVIFINVFLKNNRCMPLLSNGLWFDVLCTRYRHGFEHFLLVMDINLRAFHTCQNLFCFHLEYNGLGSLFVSQKVRCQLQKIEEQKTTDHIERQSASLMQACQPYNPSLAALLSLASFPFCRLSMLSYSSMVLESSTGVTSAVAWLQ